MFKLGWGHRTKFYEVVEAEGEGGDNAHYNLEHLVKGVGTQHKIL